MGLLPSSAKEFKAIAKYYECTKPGKGSRLLKVFSLDRAGEKTRMAAHKKLGNRRLLWHGTSPAVVAAILKSGLRIMPHSGGRVGKGIYLADQHQKSVAYTRSARGTTIMFLVEAALGNAHEIFTDDPILKAAPKGFDSVLAKGRKAPPNEKGLGIDGKSVAVPSGKPQVVPSAKKSSFYHNEFLLYQESQHRIRYVLSFG